MRPAVTRSEGEWLAHSYPPIEYVVDPWLTTSGLAMIWGWRGLGKTYFSLSLACAIATGGAVLSFAAPKARTVLYVDGEMPPSMVQQRWQALKCGIGQDQPVPNFRILSHADQPQGIPDLATLDGQDWLEEALGDAEVLFLDNLSSLFRSGAENESDDWRSAQEWLVWLRGQGKTVVMIHHANKEGEDGRQDQRGTSKREDILDTVLALRNLKPKRPRCFQIQATKARGFEPWEPGIPVRIVSEGDATRLEPWKEDRIVDEPVALRPSLAGRFRT